MRFDSIICFAGGDWWYHNPHSYNHIMRIMSDTRKVLYINSLPVGGISTGAGSAKKILNKLRSIIKYMRRVKRNLWIFTPLFIPFRGSKMLASANQALLRLQLKAIMRMTGMRRPLIWVTNPYGYLYAENTEFPVLYQIVDKVTEYRNAGESVKAMDKGLCEKAEYIITPGKELYNEKNSLYPGKVHRIKHAVDFSHFSAVTAKPADFPETDKPVFTYWGSVDYKKVHYELVKYLSEHCKDMHFLFIGRVFDFPAGDFNNAGNISFIGARPYEALPSYAGYSTGFMVPWDPEDKMNQNASPIKIREYLCTGKPVITTYIPEFDEYSDYICISRTNKEFAENLRSSLRDDSEVKASARREFAALNSWENVVNEINHIISDSD